MTHSTTAVAAVTGLALALGFAQPAAAQPSPDDAPTTESTPPAAPAADPTPAAPASAPAPAAPSPADAAAAVDSAIPAGADSEIIEISDTAPAESASSVHISEDDLKYRSRTQVSDILRQVPG